MESLLLKSKRSRVSATCLQNTDKMLRFNVGWRLRWGWWIILFRAGALMSQNPFKFAIQLSDYYFQNTNKRKQQKKEAFSFYNSSHLSVTWTWVIAVCSCAAVQLCSCLCASEQSRAAVLAVFCQELTLSRRFPTPARSLTQKEQEGGLWRLCMEFIIQTTLDSSNKV